MPPEIYHAGSKDQLAGSKLNLKRHADQESRNRRLIAYSRIYVSRYYDQCEQHIHNFLESGNLQRNGIAPGGSNDPLNRQLT